MSLGLEKTQQQLKFDRDWGRRNYPGLPPSSQRMADLANAANRAKPNPFALMNGGFQEEDEILIDWASSAGANFGLQISAFRNLGGRSYRLRWLPAGPLRDQAGRYLYAPYLSLSDVCEFVQMLAMISGYDSGELQSATKTSRRFVLYTGEGESLRLIPGDQLCFNWKERSFHVERRQGTVDMNLRPLDREGFVLKRNLGYMSLPHHQAVLARVMAEVNGFYSRVLDGDKFEVVRP